MKQALARARAYVRTHGDELAGRRADVLVGAAVPAVVDEALGALQAADGGFSAPTGAERDSGVAGTLAALAVFDELRRLDGPAVERAAAWLATRQCDDGSWACHVAQERSARLVVTGLLGGYLARSPHVSPSVLERAGDFLASGWSVERVQAGDYGALVAFAPFFSSVAHELSDAALQWCGRELERGFRGGRLCAVRTARVFTLCDALALPGARVASGELVPALLAEQHEDGGWLPDLGCTALRVGATLDAVLALVRFAPRVPG